MQNKELLETKEENYIEEKKTVLKKVFPIIIRNKKIFLIIVALLVVFISGVIIGLGMSKENSIFSANSPIVDNEVINITPDIDVTYLNTALKEASELTTAKLKINGLVDFADTGVVILNRSDFVMKYTAEISAGIDMSKVEVKEDDIDNENKKIIVSIPKATVFKPNVYHGKENIKFYNEKFTLFNVNEKEDLSEALALAEKEAEKEVVNNGLLELADKQSETLIKGILSDAVSIAAPGYAIEIKYIDEETKNAEE